jgi:hypothetical protein
MRFFGARATGRICINGAKEKNAEDLQDVQSVIFGVCGSRFSL